MKKPHILNRPMFNKGGTSAYGRGIASNLVTDEQRQRFNSGGRVRLQGGTNYRESDIYKELYPPNSLIGSTNELLTNVTQGLHNYIARPLSNIPPYVFGYGEGLNTYKPRDFRKELVERWDPDWEKNLQAKKGTEKNKNKFDNRVSKIIKDRQVEELEQKKRKKITEGEDKKDPNVIDLTASERAGLKATLYAGAGAGALDPSNKTVTDVIISALLGANKAGKEIYDPTTERKYRRYAEAHKDIQGEAFKRKTEWETSDEKLMAERAATIGKQAAHEEAVVGKQVPKTGTGAEYKTIKKSINKSKEKGTPLAGLIVFDTDIQKYMVWDTDRKEYIHVSDNIDDVKKLVRG